MEPQVFTINRSTIRIVLGSITDARTDVIVSSDDGYLSHGGGVSEAIYHATGGKIADEISKIRGAHAGDVLVTSGGDLPAKYILHAVTLDADTWALPSGAVVRQVTRRVIELLPILRCRSVAFPAIGSGVARVPIEEVAAQMAEALVRALLETSESYEVEIYLLGHRFGQLPADEVFGYFARHLTNALGLNASQTGDGLALEAPLPDVPVQTEDVQNGGHRREQIYLMLRHLDDRRDALESSLLQRLAHSEAGQTIELTRLRAQIEELRKLRRGYESELGRDSAMPRLKPHGVFLSSTWVDLQQHRASLRKLIVQQGFPFVGMEEFLPAGIAPAEYIRQRVEESEVYVGVLGMRYGSIDPSSGFSMTELEYRQAVADDKQRYLFVMDERAPITFEAVEQSPQGLAKLLDFRALMLRDNVCAKFRTVEDLVERARQTLSKHSERKSVAT